MPTSTVIKKVKLENAVENGLSVQDSGSEWFKTEGAHSQTVKGPGVLSRSGPKECAEKPFSTAFSRFKLPSFLWAPLWGAFFFCSCTSSSQWQISQGCDQSVRHTFPCSNPYRGLEVEMIQDASGAHMYLNAFSRQFPQHASDPTQTLVTLSTDTSSQTTSAYRLRGGQRLLLPEKAANWILSTLNQSQAVIITVGRYHTTISP